MAKGIRVLNIIHKGVVLGDDGTKSGSDAYGKPMLHAQQLGVSVLSRGQETQNSQTYTFYTII